MGCVASSAASGESRRLLWHISRPHCTMLWGDTPRCTGSQNATSIPYTERCTRLRRSTSNFGASKRMRRNAVDDMNPAMP